MPYTIAIQTLLYCILIAQTSALNFSNCPRTSRQSLENAFLISECLQINTSPLSDIDTCLCTNGGRFLENTANFLRHGHRPLVEDVWNALVLDCEKSGTPIEYSVAEFLHLGMGMPYKEHEMQSLFGVPLNLGKWSLRKLSFILFKIGVSCAITGFVLYVALRLLETGKLVRWSGACWRWLWNQSG